MPETAGESAVIGKDVWRPLRGPFQRWPQLTNLLIALVALALTLAMWSQGAGRDTLSMDSFQDVGVYLLAFIGSFALLWRRSHPWQVHAVVLAASISVYAAAPADGIVALAFSLYSLGRYEANSRTSLIGALAALVFIIFDLGVFDEPAVGSTIAAMMVLALWYVGRRLRFRGEYLRLLEERALHLERDSNAESDRAVVAERTRIAREMHDVVAHQISLMTVQAGAARTISASNPEAAGDAMAAVEAAGRHALSEMRHLLGVLRPANEEDALGPQPGINDLPALVRKVSDAGPAVQLQTTGELTELPSRLELTAYRLVQEALTNVIKHAGTDARVNVTIDGRSDGIVITIRDDGKGGAVEHSSGHGIIGMRERAELLGGSVRASGCVDGGFEVRALLPRESRAR